MSVPILGLLQTTASDEANNGFPAEGQERKARTADGTTAGPAGRIAVYGDSNCIDDSHLHKPCFWMLDALLAYTTTGHVPSVFMGDNPAKRTEDLERSELPRRMEGSHLRRHSKVLLPDKANGGNVRPLPNCPHLLPAPSRPVNESAPANLYKSQKLLSVGEAIVVGNPAAPDSHSHSNSDLDSDSLWLKRRAGAGGAGAVGAVGAAGGAGGSRGASLSGAHQPTAWPDARGANALENWETDKEDELAPEGQTLGVTARSGYLAAFLLFGAILLCLLYRWNCLSAKRHSRRKRAVGRIRRVIQAIAVRRVPPM